MEVNQKHLEYTKKVIRSLYNISEDDSIYDDVISIAYEATFKACKNFDKTNAASINTVIFRYVRNAVSNFLRSTYVKSFDKNNADIEAIDKETMSMIDLLETYEKLDIALKRINTYSKTDRDAFLDWIKGYSFKEISQKYNVSKSSLYRLIDTILKDIKDNV